MRKSRLVRWIALGLALLSVGLLSSAVPASVAGAAEGYRSIDGLDFSSLDDLLVSEAHNRVIIVGDGRLEFIALNSLAPVVAVSPAAGILDPRVQGSSVFFAGTDGVIVELALLDGVVVNEWSTGAVNVTSIAVEDQWIWYTFGESFNDAGVARLNRVSGSQQQITISEKVHERTLIRLSAARPEEFFLGNTASSSGQISRYRLDGLSAALEAISPWQSFVRSFEASADGERVWSRHGGVYRPVEMYAESMGVSAVTYEGAFPPDIALEATAGHLMASIDDLDGGGQVVRLFDRGVPVARNVFALGHDESEVALTTSEVLVATKLGPGVILQAWSLDYESQAHSVEISVIGHGVNNNGAYRKQLRCAGGFIQDRQAEMGETMVFDLPAGVNHCFFTIRRDHRRPTLVGRRVSGAWSFDQYDTVEFDARDGEEFMIVDYFDWPGNNFDELIRQMYLDLFGRQINFMEFNEIEYQVRQDGLRNDSSGFILNVMDNPGAYERTHAPIARLYRAFFLRDPDVGGHAYWVGLANGGLSLALTAEYFEVSEEFNLRYGDLDDREFVALVYQNVMGREPDQGGYDYWLDQMDRGMTRGELMIYFSDSPEYRNKVSGRVFVVYASRILEQRDPSEADIGQLLAAFQTGGREAVVAATLEGDAYYHRFWIGGPPPLEVGPG